MPTAPNILALKKVCLNPAASRYPTLQLSVGARLMMSPTTVQVLTVFFFGKMETEDDGQNGRSR